MYLRLSVLFATFFYEREIVRARLNTFSTEILHYHPFTGLGVDSSKSVFSKITIVIFSTGQESLVLARRYTFQPKFTSYKFEYFFNRQSILTSYKFVCFIQSAFHS
jgi:hypothetical protein